MPAGQSDTTYTRIVVYSAVFAALVFAATLISVETPTTKGYFNLGESMVYTAAILLGPLVGAIAGGLGSAMADVYLGYGHYAPGTLVIKGLEGYIVGLLALKLMEASEDRARLVARLSAVLVAGGVILAGALVYSGLYGGDTILYIFGRQVEFRVPLWAWIVVGVLAGAAILYVERRRGPRHAARLAAMLVGGLEMVAGYFLYEAIVLQYGLAAAAEIPVNIGQALIGAAIASWLVSIVEEAGVRL